MGLPLKLPFKLGEGEGTSEGIGVVQAFVEEVYTDRGVVYTGNGELGAYWKGPWEPFSYFIFRHRIKAPFLKKRMRQLFFNGEGVIEPIVYKNFHVGGRREPATVNNENMAAPELPTNFGAEEAKFGEGTETFGEGEALFGGEATVGAARMYALGVADVWSVGWGNSSAEPFVVDAFVYMVQFRKS